MADDVRVVDTGLLLLTNVLTGTSAMIPKYIRWGTSTEATSDGDTGLTAMSTKENAVTGTLASTDTSSTGDTYKVTGTVVAATSHTIGEVGLFCGSATDSTMFLRGVFDTIAVNEGDSIAFTINTVFAQSTS